MKLTIALALILRVFIQELNAEELNLNQHDYELKFERTVVVRYNKNMFKDFSIVTFKYNRTIAVANLTLTLKVDLGHDLECVVQVYKFMSNEYRFFPLQVAVNGCKAIAANVGGMQSALSKCGNFIGCPLAKGIKYYACNVYPDPEKLPPFMPNGQYMAQIQMLHASQELGVVNVYVVVSRPIV